MGASQDGGPAVSYVIVERSSVGTFSSEYVYEDLPEAQEVCDRWNAGAEDVPVEFEVQELRPIEHAGERLVVVVNSNLTMSRGKAAAQAIHAALMLLGVHHGGPVIVLGGKPTDIGVMPIRIHDAGMTEVARGALTAGAEWRSR